MALAVVHVFEHSLIGLLKFDKPRGSEDKLNKIGHFRGFMKKGLYSHATKTHFQKKGFAFYSLVLKERVFGTQN